MYLSSLQQEKQYFTDKIILKNIENRPLLHPLTGPGHCSFTTLTRPSIHSEQREEKYEDGNKLQQQ